jgi:hypothetical protein
MLSVVTKSSGLKISGSNRRIRVFNVNSSCQKATGYMLYGILYEYLVQVLRVCSITEAVKICPLWTNFLQKVVDTRYAYFSFPGYKEEYPTT